MRTLQAGGRELDRNLWQLAPFQYAFEHKTQYLLIHALYTRIGVFRHKSNIPPRSSHSQIG